LGLLSAGLSGTARAEADTVRIAKQFGLGYLPLTLMERRKNCFEQQAEETRARYQGRMAPSIGPALR